VSGTRYQISHFAHRLAGNGAGLQSGSADLGLAFDDRGTFAHARRLPRRMLSSWAGTDDENVVVHAGGRMNMRYLMRIPGCAPSSGLRMNSPGASPEAANT